MWPATDSISAGIFARAAKVLPGGISRTLTWVDPFPIYARKGQGAYIEDADGVRRLDLMNNFASLIHGHAHPGVLARVGAAMADGTCFALPTELEVRLAELICGRIASVDKVRFCNSGTEAVMLALKAARARPGRTRIAKLEGAYHGMYDWAEVSLDSSPADWGNAPKAKAYAHATPKGVLDDTVVLPLNQPEAAERLIREAGGSLAAVLIDPVPSTFGMIEMTPAYIEALQRAARAVGALIVIDEVIALRLDYHGAQERYGIRPDLTTFAKIIGGGFPVGAVAGTDDAMDVFSHTRGKPLNPSSGTFTGNPVSMTAGLATMELLTPDAYAGLEALGDHARAVLRGAFAAAGRPGQVTGVGSMFQLHLHDRPLTDYRSAYPQGDEAAAAKALHRAMLDRGVIFSPRGSGFLSTVNTGAEIDEVGEKLADALRTLD